jgi:hypothetical protein
VDSTGRPQQDGPPRTRWSLIALVVLGGAIGTAVRAGLAQALPAVDGISWTILAINVVGVFCLGLLLDGPTTPPGCSTAVCGRPAAGTRCCRSCSGSPRSSPGSGRA